jgi:hypothetical protein
MVIICMAKEIFSLRNFILLRLRGGSLDGFYGDDRDNFL